MQEKFIWINLGTIAHPLITDAKGNKVGVILRIKQYVKMIKALEDKAAVGAFDKSKKRRSKQFPPGKRSCKLKQSKRERSKLNELNCIIEKHLVKYFEMLSP
jgi:hypothetical protein